jgi:hypothetical protein
MCSRFSSLLLRLHHGLFYCCKLILTKLLLLPPPTLFNSIIHVIIHGTIFAPLPWPPSTHKVLTITERRIRNDGKRHGPHLLLLPQREALPVGHGWCRQSRQQHGPGCLLVSGSRRRDGRYSRCCGRRHRHYTRCRSGQDPLDI